MISYSTKIYEMLSRFSGTKYNHIVEDSINAYLHDNFDRIDENLKKLPTNLGLLESLIEKIKGKPVYSNLRKVVNKENVSNDDMKIALSSLFTRVVIESKDNAEYAVLQPLILKKLIRICPL